MPSNASAFDRLIQRFSRLPGIGQRSAQRIAFYLLKASREEAMELAEAIRAFKTDLKACSICGNVTEADPCPICADPRRDRGIILVVEQPSDIASLEQTGIYRGLYHVLMGRLAPLEGVGPGELNVEGLLGRAGRRKTQDSPSDPRRLADAPAGLEGVGAGDGGAVREVILGVNPTLEGEGTMLYLADELARRGVKVTRLARGLPTGSNLATASKAVLSDAIQGRRSMAEG